MTAALDPELTGEVLEIIRKLALDGTTMVLATHEMAFARDVATKVCFLHDGAILEQGPPDQVLGDPREERTRQFLRRVLHRTVPTPGSLDTRPIRMTRSPRLSWHDRACSSWGRGPDRCAAYASWSWPASGRVRTPA